MRRIPYTALRAVIPCQSFGLDRKKQVFRLAFFLAPPAGLEPATTCIPLAVLGVKPWEYDTILNNREDTLKLSAR